MIASIIFIVLFTAGFAFFAKRLLFIKRTIFLGKNKKINDSIAERWKIMFKVAIGQSKIIDRPLAGIMHVIVYLGFILVNVEMLEIIIDGIFHTHRTFAFTGGFYTFLINGFEFFALAVIIACITFLVRRNIGKVKRFHSAEMTTWPKSDANIILFTEIALMSAFLIMNASDGLLQLAGNEHYVKTGDFLISGMLMPLFENFSAIDLRSFFSRF